MIKVMINQEIIKRNLKYFGERAVVDNAVEELAELIQAVQKSKRATSDYEYASARNAIIEEMADVHIVLANLQEIFEVNQIELQSNIDAKQQRQVTRIAKHMRVSEK